MGKPLGKRRITVLPLVITVMMFFVAETVVLPFLEHLSLQQMVERSEMIVIGEVIKLEKTGKTYSGGAVREYNATIEIERIIKGDPIQKQVEVIYALPGPESPKFKIGERSLLFIERHGDRRSVLNLLAGKLTIEGAIVKPLFIAGEPKQQGLEEFVAQITKILEMGN